MYISLLYLIGSSIVFAKVSGYGNNKPHPQQHVQLHWASKLSTTASASAEDLLLFFYSALCSQNLDTHSQFWCHSLPSCQQVSLSLSNILVQILFCCLLLLLMAQLLYLFSPFGQRRAGTESCTCCTQWRHLSCESFFFLYKIFFHLFHKLNQSFMSSELS